MSKKVSFIFGLWLLTFIILGIICSSDKKLLSIDDINQQVTSQDLIYFQNIRSIHYSKLSVQGNGMDQYKLKALKEAPISPSFVYIYAQKSAFILFEKVPAQKIRIEGSDLEIFFGEDLNAQDHLLISFVLLQAIENKKKITLESNGSVWSLSPENRFHLKLVLEDYFRLIGALA